MPGISGSCDDVMDHSDRASEGSWPFQNHSGCAMGKRARPAAFAQTIRIVRVRVSNQKRLVFDPAGRWQAGACRRSGESDPFTSCTQRDSNGPIICGPTDLGVQQLAAVPDPALSALPGTSLSSLLAYRPFFKRTKRSSKA
jgi:hypothetical protein